MERWIAEFVQFSSAIVNFLYLERKVGIWLCYTQDWDLRFSKISPFPKILRLKSLGYLVRKLMYSVCSNNNVALIHLQWMEIKC